MLWLSVRGSKRVSGARIAEMGSNMIMIHPGADMRGGYGGSGCHAKSGNWTIGSGVIVDETRYVSACSPSVSSSGQTDLRIQ